MTFQNALALNRVPGPPDAVVAGHHAQRGHPTHGAAAAVAASAADGFMVVVCLPPRKHDLGVSARAEHCHLDGNGNPGCVSPASWFHLA